VPTRDKDYVLLFIEGTATAPSTNQRPPPPPPPPPPALSQHVKRRV